MSDQYSCNTSATKSSGSAGAKRDYNGREGKYAEKSPDELLLSEDGHIPTPFKDSRDFFQSSDKMERKNGVRSRNVMAALPRELNNDQKKALARDIAETLSGQLADRDGHKLPYHVAIHNDKSNPHMHLMFSERMNDLGREYSDKKDFFSRSNPKTNQFRQNRKDNLVALRETVADVINQHLHEAGIEDTWTHLSYADRGIDKQAGHHLGPATAHALKNGRMTKRAEYIAMQSGKPADRLATAADIADHSAGIVGRYDAGRLTKMQAVTKAEVTALKRPTPTQKDLYRDFDYRKALKSAKSAYSGAKSANDAANKAKKDAKDAQREADQLPASYKIGEAIAVWIENKMRAAFGLQPVLTTQQLAQQQAQQAQQLRQQADAKFDTYKSAKSDLAGAKAAVADKLYEAKKAAVTAEYREYLGAAKGRQEGFELMRDDFKVEIEKLRRDDPQRRIEGDLKAHIAAPDALKAAFEDFGYTVNPHNGIVSDVEGREWAQVDADGLTIDGGKHFKREAIEVIKEAQHDGGAGPVTALDYDDRKALNGFNMRHIDATESAENQALNEAPSRSRDRSAGLEM